MPEKCKIACIFGTRPEVIKLAPIIYELKKISRFELDIIHTGQHIELVDNILNIFQLAPNYTLNVMKHDQSLAHLTAELSKALEKIFQEQRYDLVIAQGDTTSTLMAALIAFYHKVPFFHVEAGLRSHDIEEPFPEELNRVLISKIAKKHFAPTEQNKQTLIAEGVLETDIFVTGNTVVDSLQWISKQLDFKPKVQTDKKIIVVTLHRRENLGDNIESIFNTLVKLTENFRHIKFIIPVHLNPHVQRAAKAILSNKPNIELIEPLDYLAFIELLNQAFFIMTDSGGIQEEAPILGKPVLVLRNKTESMEGVELGVADLIGTRPENIYTGVSELLCNPKKYQSMIKAVSPYGDGNAAKKIIGIIKDYL